jgi:RES domain-containing protein
MDAVIAVESLTNDRLRDATGEVRRVPEEDRVAGPGASYVMAPFTHISPAGGRFSDVHAGAYYAARVRTTAIRETVHHRERFLAATAERPIDLEMRMIEADLDGRLHDVRGLREEMPELYAADSYDASQAWARRVRAAGSNGVVYASVRHSGGQCVAVFRPRLLKRARQAEHLLYRWDGKRISEVFELTLRLP